MDGIGIGDEGDDARRSTTTTLRAVPRADERQNIIDASDKASVPGLPGCWSQGATEAEALENVRVAISEYLRAVSDLLKDADVREIDVKV